MIVFTTEKQSSSYLYLLRTKRTNFCNLSNSSHTNLQFDLTKTNVSKLTMFTVKTYILYVFISMRFCETLHWHELYVTRNHIFFIPKWRTGQSISVKNAWTRRGVQTYSFARVTSCALYVDQTCPIVCYGSNPRPLLLRLSSKFCYVTVDLAYRLSLRITCPSL